MIINSEIIEYLRGNRISNGYCFKIMPQNHINDRLKILKEVVSGKSVLHIGCCDHINLVHEKIRKGIYLHDVLKNVAKKITGVDINVEGIKLMHSIGFEDVYLPSELPNNKYDILLLPDVIEHISDVQMFLTSLHQYDFQRIVVTTPNAYRLINRRHFCGELINTDHRYWFSPFTLAKVLVNAGFEVERIEFTDTPSRRNFVRNLILKKFPLLQDGLLVIAKKRECASIFITNKY